MRKRICYRSEAELEERFFDIYENRRKCGVEGVSQAKRFNQSAVPTSVLYRRSLLPFTEGSLAVLTLINLRTTIRASECRSYKVFKDNM